MDTQGQEIEFTDNGNEQLTLKANDESRNAISKQNVDTRHLKVYPTS